MKVAPSVDEVEPTAIDRTGDTGISPSETKNHPKLKRAGALTRLNVDQDPRSLLPTRRIIAIVILASAVNACRDPFNNTTPGYVINTLFLVNLSLPLTCIVMGSFVFKTYELPMGNKTMFLALILLRAGVMIGHTVQKERFDFYKANLAMGFLFFLTAHFSYPLSPPTFYTNYAMPFWYALGFLWHTSSLISPTTSFFVFLAYVSYGIGISAWLLAKGNPQTRASSQYLALVAFLTPCGGWAIGTLLMQMRTSSTFWKSIALQCCSTVILSIAHPSALRASDKDKFAILMFGVYLGVDIGQTLLFLEVKLGTLEFFKCVIVQELAGIWKNSGVKEFCLFIVGRRKINPFRDEDYVSVLMKKGMVDTMSEVLAVISVLVMFLVEKALLPYTTPVIVTKHQVRNDTVTDTIEWEFESPVCVTTCAGWVASDGLEEKEDKSATGVTALVVVVLVFR